MSHKPNHVNGVRLLIVEDDFSYEDILRRKLSEFFPEAEFHSLTTEAGFRKKIDKLAQKPPTAIIMDIMLPWESPKPNPQDRPDDVEREGLTKAGFRCRKLLDQCTGDHPIPMVLYSAMPAVEIQDSLKELPPHVAYLTKDQIDRLPRVIEQLAGLVS